VKAYNVAVAAWVLAAFVSGKANVYITVGGYGMKPQHDWRTPRYSVIWLEYWMRPFMIVIDTPVSSEAEIDHEMRAIDIAALQLQQAMDGVR
jgi:hypothetical protein